MTKHSRKPIDFVSHERLTELLAYDPATGVFSRRIGRGAAGQGRRAGTLGSSGYLRIMIDGRSYLAHRLAWFYQTKEWPTHEVDHRNRVKVDNRWVNLRLATRSQNACNRPRKESALPLGVFRRGSRFTARICHENDFRTIGTYATAEEAAAAFDATAKALRGDFAASHPTTSLRTSAT